MEILFNLADFLPRIPSHLLLHHALNPKAELRFKFPEICHRLANGKTTIDLVEIYCRVPQIFRAEVRKGDNREILLPWRRIAEMLKLSRPPCPATASAADLPGAIGGAVALERKIEARRGITFVRTEA